MDEAERLALEAVTIAERTDWLNLQGDAYMSLGAEPGSVPSFDRGGGLSFIDRSELVASVEQDEDLILCGVDAPPCAPATDLTGIGHDLTIGKG